MRTAFLAITISGLLATGLFSGCGSSDDTPADTTGAGTGGAAGTAGAGGSTAGTSATGGKGGTSGKGGSAGSAGQGGAAGAGGATGGHGGTAGGNGGSTGGSGGKAGGGAGGAQGGAGGESGGSAGAGGAQGGAGGETGGSAGAGGDVGGSAGAGGEQGGAGGESGGSAGAGGDAGGTGGTGGTTGGSGGSAGMAAQADLSCVGMLPKFPDPTGATVNFDFYVTSAYPVKPIPPPVAGALVKACAFTDKDCASPLAMGTSDATGKVNLTVPAGTHGFDGYLDVTLTGQYPTIAFFNHPIIGNPASGAYGVGVFNAGIFKSVPATVKVTLDDTAGHTVDVFYDCGLANAPGITAVVTPADPMGKAKTVYAAGASLSATATATDASGASFTFNQPVGDITVTGTQTSTGKAMTANGFIRAKTLAALAVQPNFAAP